MGEGKKDAPHTVEFMCTRLSDVQCVTQPRALPALLCDLLIMLKLGERKEHLTAGVAWGTLTYIKHGEGRDHCVLLQLCTSCPPGSMKSLSLHAGEAKLQLTSHGHDERRYPEKERYCCVRAAVSGL